MIFRSEIINDIINRYSFTKYLEVGVSEGGTFKKVRAKHKVGCDPIYGGRIIKVDDTGSTFYGITSDEFFKINTEEFQVVFIDGLHRYRQVVKDIVNSWNTLQLGGFICLHDCRPLNEEAAAIEYPGPSKPWNGDVYKSILWFLTEHKDKVCFVLNCDCGMGVIHKTEEEDLLFPDEAELDKYEVTYPSLVSDDIRLLNLKEEGYLAKYLIQDRRKYA